MSRFEKKCFVGSAVLHGLLLGTFLFSSAFLASKPQNPVVSVITILPQSMEAFGRADGNPDPPAAATPKPEPRPPVAEVPKPVPPEVKPEPVKPPQIVKAPEPEKKAEPIVKDRGELPASKPTKKPDVAQKNTTSNPSLLTKAITRTNEVALRQAQEAERQNREAAAKANAQRSMALAAAKEAMGIGKGLSQSTVTTPLGTSFSGGTVVGSYGERLKAMYDARWSLGHDLSDDESVASVSVVVARDGTVKSHRIVKPSGNSAFDRSVRQCLEAVRTAPPFPAEMKEAEREFTWKFERKLRAG